jgi:multidrug efflux pump subunit AcrB
MTDSKRGLYARLLENHPLANIAFVVVIGLGVLSYLMMPRERDPEINFNWVNITTVLPGASAEDVEQRITQPLEDAIRNVQDIRFVSSNSRESVSNILVRFREIPERIFDKRISDLRREIQNKANAELPIEAQDPLIIEITTSNGFPTAQVVVAGQADDENLRLIARQTKEDLERIPGVDNVLAFGLHDPELHIDFDPVALAGYGLTATDLADGMRGWFRDVFAGRVRTGDGQWLVRVAGTTADPESLAGFRIAPTMIPGSERKVPLDAVAIVQRGREEAQQLAAIDGQPAVSLGINKIANVNTLVLIQRIRDYIEQRNQILEGSGIRLVLADDQTVYTEQAIGIMQTNAVVGLLLVLAVCWVFLGLQIATLVSLGVVFAVAGVFALVAASGSSLNVSVLLGVVIALGMLVDASVVVVEAIYYRLQRGVESLQAALEAVREIGLPITSAVATTLAAFLPLMLLPGILGKFLFVVPFVVSIGLVMSLIQALWMLPTHTTTLARPATSHAERHDWRWRMTHWIRLRYTRWLVVALRRPLLTVGAGVLAMVMAVVAVGSNLVRVEFFAFDPLPIYYVHVDMPPETPLEETLRAASQVEAEVRRHLNGAEAREVITVAGVKFTETEPLYGDQYAQVMVSLNPFKPGGRTLDDIIEGMRAPVTSVPIAGEISFLRLSGGPPTAKPINVKVRSDDFSELREAADAIRAIVSAVEGTRDVVDDDVPGRPELSLELDLVAVRNAGLDPGMLARLLRLHVDGEVVADMRDRGEKVELRVRAARGPVSDVAEVLNDPIVLPGGGITTLGSLVTASTRDSRGTIRHYSFRRAITVEADLDQAVIDTRSANQRIQSEWESVRAQFPATDLEFSGELDDIEESLGALGPLFLLGIGLIYLILAAQFKSYFQPLLILVTVPMAFTGVVFGLLLSGNPLSLYTMYGTVALTGIAVNAAIVLIDAANARIAIGMRTLHATVYAARRRVVPILMTTTTTIAGLFALATGLGGKSLLWGPVAASIVWGLAVASILTLFVVPVLYRFFMRGRGGSGIVEGALS